MYLLRKGKEMSHNPNTVKSFEEVNEGKRSSEVLLSAIDKIADLEEWKKDMQAKYGNKSAENKELEFKIMALESELKAVCDVLIKISPQHRDWVMSNWKYLYEVNK